MSCTTDMMEDEMIALVPGEIVDQKELAERLLAQARERGVSLTGPGGLLSQLTKNWSAWYFVDSGEKPESIRTCKVKFWALFVWVIRVSEVAPLWGIGCFIGGWVLQTIRISRRSSRCVTSLL